MGSIFTLGFLVSRSCQADEESDKWGQNTCVSNAFIVLCQDPVSFFTAQTFQPNILVTHHANNIHFSKLFSQAQTLCLCQYFCRKLWALQIVGVTIHGSDQLCPLCRLRAPHFLTNHSYSHSIHQLCPGIFPVNIKLLNCNTAHSRQSGGSRGHFPVKLGPKLQIDEGILNLTPTKANFSPRHSTFICTPIFLVTRWSFRDFNLNQR